MKSYVRSAASALLALLLAAPPASAQWQTPNHSVPIGMGAGNTGFNNAAPGATGGILTSNGPSADPSFSPLNGICSIGPSVCVALLGYANPAWYGGSTANADNSAAFNAAAAAAKVVRVTDTSAPWMLTASILLNAGNRLECANGAVIKRGNSATMTTMVNFYSNVATGASLVGCTIDGNRANNADDSNFYAVNVSTVDDVQILNNTIQNVPGSATNMAGLRPIVAGNTFNNVYQLAIAVTAVSPSTPQFAKVYNNRILGTAAHAIYLYQGDHNDIYDNTIDLPIALGGAGTPMNVTVSGTTATWVGGANFAGASAGMFLVVNGGFEAQITQVVSNTQLTLSNGFSFTNVPAAIGPGDQISVNSVSYNKIHGNRIYGGATGGVVLSNESASTESAVGNQIYGNYAFDIGAYCYVIDGNPSFGSTVVNDTQLVGNYCIGPGRNYPGGAAPAGIQLYAGAGRVNGVLIDGNYVFDPFTLTGGYWLTSFGLNNATNVTFGTNVSKGFANGASALGYPTYASLPGGNPKGVRAFIIDGQGGNCGDGTCLTYGTSVGGGGGTLTVPVINIGTGWVRG
jgi:hypothetical protein